MSLRDEIISLIREHPARYNAVSADLADAILALPELKQALEDSERYKFCKTLEGQVLTVEIFSELRERGGVLLDEAIDKARGK